VYEKKMVTIPMSKSTYPQYPQTFPQIF